jgi:hypothetical protein
MSRRLAIVAAWTGCGSACTGALVVGHRFDDWRVGRFRHRIRRLRVRDWRSLWLGRRWCDRRRLGSPLRLRGGRGFGDGFRRCFGRLRLRLLLKGGNLPALHAAGQHQPEQRALRLVQVERNELQHLARGEQAVDTREQIALGERERALVGERARGHEPLVEVAERRAHSVVVAHLPHRLEDQRLRRDGHHDQVVERLAAFLELDALGVVRQALDQPVAQRSGGGGGRRVGARRRLEHADLGEHALEAQPHRVVGLGHRRRQRGLGRRRAERHDLAGLELHPQHGGPLPDDEQAGPFGAERLREKREAASGRRLLGHQNFPGR